MPTTPRRSRRRSRIVPLTVLVSAASMALTGCTVSGQAPGATSTAAASAVPSAVQERLSTALKVPELTSPGDVVDTGRAKGRSVFVIPLFSSNEYNQYIDQAMVEAGQLTGTKVTVFANQGQVNQWVAGINQAVSSKADVLVLGGGIDPRLLLPQIAKARDAGLKVISSQFFDEDYTASGCGSISLTCAEGLDAVVPAPYTKTAQLDADWIIADSGAKAHTLVLTASDVGPNAFQEAAIKAEFKARCPGCTQTYVDIPSSQWATNTRSAVQSALTKDPTITHILPVYDVLAADSATAVGVSGRTGKVKIATFNGTPAVLAQIQSGTTVAADAAQNLAQIGYANMDQAYRLLAGAEPTSSARDVIRLFEKSNVAEAGTPPKANGGFGDGYLAEYKKVWGL